MKEIEIPEFTHLSTLADLIDVPASRLVQAGFEDLGRLLTIEDALQFEDARALLARFGYVARLRRD